jgi:hypothetical protein
MLIAVLSLPCGFLLAPHMQDVGGAAASKYMRAETLRVELEEAVTAERFSQAASIRDELAALTKDAEVAVRDANAHFYNALRQHDADAMERIWPDGALADSSTRVFSGFPVMRGRCAILDLWREVRIGVHTTDTRCKVLRGGLSAVVTCVERELGGGPGDGALAATNVYEKDELRDEWRLVLHQAWPMAEEVNSAEEEDVVEYDADDFPGATG